MGDQPHKTSAKPVSEATKKIKHPAPAVQAVLEAEPLSLFADPMMLQRAIANPVGLPPTAIPGLQRAVGNQHVQLMLARTEPAAGIAAQIQKQTIEGYAEQRAAPDDAPVEVAQRQPDADGGVDLSDPMTNEINRGISRGGSSLPKDTQVKMKRNLGITNPEEIQVHTDQQADTLSKTLGARAFTTGSHIFFRQGEYDPSSTKGQALLYHEGVHTVQQGSVKGNGPQTKMVVNPPDDRYEQEAEAVAEQAILAPEPTQPQFVEPSATSKTTPHVSQKDDEESDERTVPTTSYVQMAEEKEEKEESKEEKKEEEKEAKEEEKEKKEREEEAKEKGKEKEQEGKESSEEKKETSKSKAKGEGKRASQPKKKPPPPKIPKAADFTPPPPKVDPSVVDNIDGDMATETKFDPDAFEFEEPEQEPLLPTWDQLAEGTVQLSMEEVQEEYRIRLGLADSDPADFEGIDDPTQGFNVEPGEPAEPTKSGADLVGEAFAEGMLSGFQEGAQSWATDTALEMATSKIKYADGMINLAKLAYDPKAWVQDNVFAVGDSFMAVGSAFKGIASEKTPFGVIAATLEAAIAIIDFVNSIIGLINQILTILLWIFRVLLNVSNFMIAMLPPICIVIVFVPVFPFLWVPAVFSPIASFCSFAISWLDPLNEVVSQIGTVLGLVKFQLQPFAIMFRMLDMLAYQGDPEEMEKKQAKLQGNIQGFVSSATQRTAEQAKSRAVKGINKRRDQSKIKKLENQATTGDDPDLQARIAAKKDEFKEKYGESVEDFRGKSKKQTAGAMAKAAAAAPAAVLGQAFGVKREGGKWKAAGMYGGVAAVKKKGLKGAIKAGAKSLATTFKERRREVQQELRKEQAAVREKVRKRAEESAEKIGRKTGAARPEEVPGVGFYPAPLPPVVVPIPAKTSLGEVKGKAEEATKKTAKWIGEPDKKPKAEREAEVERGKHGVRQQWAEDQADQERRQAQDARDAAHADEIQAGEHQKKAQEAAEAKRNHEKDAKEFDKQADEAKSSAETQRKKAAEEEETQKRSEKEASDREAAFQKQSDEAGRLKQVADNAESQASAAKKEAEGKQQELGNAQEKAKAANQDLEEAKRKQQEMQEKCDKVLQGPGGMDTGKSRALRNLELAEKRLTEAQTKADAANERVAKARSELDEANTRRQKAETEAQQKKEAADKAQREADRLQTEADEKKTEAQEAGKRKADSLKKAGDFDEVAKQRRAAAKKAQDDADEAERQRKYHEDETDRLVREARDKRKEADRHDEAAEKFEFTAKKEGYRIKSLEPEGDKDLDDWIDKASKWKGESVFGGQRHGPGIIGTNLIYWLMQTPWADEEYEEARAKTDQAIALKNAGQYQQALDIVKGLNAESWQKKADSLKELLGPRGWRNETIANFETLANDIRSFYVYDPSNPPPSAGQRLKLQLNTLTPGLPAGAIRVNGGETAFVVTVIEKVGGDVNTPVTDEITDFPRGTDKVEKDYYSLLPASQRPISLAVRPKPVTFEVNDVERTYTPKYRKVNKSLQSGLILYGVWIGYESSLSFTSTPVNTATADQGYSYDIIATGGEGGDLTITAPTKPTWLSLTDNGDGTATLTGTPTDANVGAHDVKLKVEGEGGFFATQSFKLTVRAVPRFTSTPVEMVYKDNSYSYDISATDPDTAGSQLAITAPTKPDWLTLTDKHNGTATLSGTPTDEHVGAHSVELKVEDDYGHTATQEFTVTVRQPPQFTSEAPKMATVGQDYRYDITAVDAAVATLTISHVTKPGWLALSGNGNGRATLSGTPADADVGGHNVELKVEDENDYATIQKFTVTVSEPVQPKRAESAGTAVQERMAVVQRQPDPDEGQALISGAREVPQAKGIPMAGEGPEAVVQEDWAVVQRQPDPGGSAIADQDAGAIKEEEAPISGEDTRAAVWEKLAVLQRQPGPAIAGRDTEAVEGEETLMAGEEPGAAVEEDSVLQRQPDFGMAIPRPDTGAIEEEKAPIAAEEPGAAVEDDLDLLQRQPDLSGPATAGPDMEAAEGPDTLIAGEDVEATEAVQQKEEPLEVIPAPQSLVVQLQTEGEEEEDEEAFISESDIAYQKSLAARASLLEMAPEPPENMIERIQGAALAYEAADAEEYDLALQQQQVGGLIEHGQGQMVELAGAQKMTAVNKQGVAAQIQDAETQMQAQDQMQSQLASQEGQAQQTAKQGSEGQNVMSQIFGKIMSAFGMGSSQGAGDNGAQSQSGAMKSGVQDTSKTTGATADSTKTGQQSVASSKARTMKVKEGAESAQAELNQLDDKLASDLEENQEGLDELGEAAAANEESLATVQGEKERLRDEHTSTVSIAEMWAEEHRFVREQVFSQLESELA